jgi:hypothetical protein
VQGGYGTTTVEAGSGFISSQEKVCGLTFLLVMPAVDHRPEVFHVEPFETHF